MFVIPGSTGWVKMHCSSSLPCPKCGSKKTFVTVTEVHPVKQLIRRFRRCGECSHRFRTTQQAEKYDDDAAIWRRKQRRETSSRNRGLRNGRSYFTKENILEIRHLSDVEDVPYGQIAEKFGCAYQTVARIVRRERYQDIL